LAGIGAFANAKRKAREAASRELPQALPSNTQVQFSNTNKLAKFAVPRLPSGCTFMAAAGGGASTASTLASAGKRVSHDLHVFECRSDAAFVSCGESTDGGSGTAAKRIASFTKSPPNSTPQPRSDDSGNSSPVAAIMSKRASDDIENDTGGGRAFEKRTNDGGHSERNGRRNSE
jgi:hypothetical protein